MNISIGRLEHTPKAPRRDLGWRPAGRFFQGFPPPTEDLHDYEPAEHEAIATFLHIGQPTKEDSDEQRQIGNWDYSRQSRDRSMDDKESDFPGLPLWYIAFYTLIFKALLV